MSVRAGRILVVDDNDTLRGGIALALRDSWSEVTELATGVAAVEHLADPNVPPYDVVLTDLRLPGADGIAVLEAARVRDERCSVLVMTAYGSIDTAVGAMRRGAYDFVQKPLDLAQLELRIARAVDHRLLLHEVTELRAKDRAREASDKIIGESTALRAAIDLARRVAPTRSTVLVTGETGTGKELFASLIHSASSRAEGPLVKINCAALPETLLESELFGHERGAFTGADRQRVGRFEEASGGTLFLDEVGDTSAATQAKLLRVLQEQEFHRLGGTRILRTDARIVTATNQDLESRVANGSFREDLYFRLNVIRIHLPPLRERPEDLVALAHVFLQRFSSESGLAIRGFEDSALARLRAHHWPGNVRELHNTLERAVLISDGPKLRAEDLSMFSAASPGAAHGWRPEIPADGMRLHEVERELVLEALRRTGYVQKGAADLLGVSRRKLNYMIQKMGITHSGWRRNREPAREATGRPGDAS